MTVKTYTAEGGTNGNTVLAADTGSGSAWGADATTTGGPVIYSNTQKMHGSLSYKIDNTSNADNYLYATYTPSNRVAIRFYIYFSGALSTYTRLVDLQPSTVSNQISMVTTGTRALRIDSLTPAYGIWTGTGTTTSLVPALNTWYRVELKADNTGGAAAGTAQCDIFVGDSLTPYDTTGSSLTGMNYGTGAFEKIYLGRRSGTVALGNPFYLDDIATSDGATTFIGPSIVDPFTWTKTITIGG